ncbi:MAG TPA: choice-of-anchor D domain-containing protein [Candidatus Dormibacteraeota bacterium]|nr:choice-of-anchor D domain-containing protein [Candidatus Dormibacteraeota bacterium]
MGIKGAVSINQRAGSFRSVLNQRRRVALALAAVALVPLLAISGCSGIISAQNPKPAAQTSIRIIPSTLDFGNTRMGAKVSQAATVVNDGKSAVVISQASMVGAQFSVSDLAYPFTVLPGQSTKFNVWFHGTVAGNASGMLSLTADNRISSSPLELRAKVTDAQPQLGIAPSSLNFGNVTAGTTATRVVILSNTGNANLTITTVTVTGAPFTTTGITTPATVAPGGNVALNVMYSPKTASTDTGLVTISTNDPIASTATISLSGAGTTAAVGQLTLNPASLNFGNIPVGGNGTLAATVTNSGQAAVHITQVSTTDAQYAVSGLNVPTALNPGQSATLQVKYAPTTAVPTNGSVSLISDIQGSPTILILSGKGAQAAIGVSPASLNFGNVAANASKLQTLTISNAGNASLTITQANLSGASFSISGFTTAVTLAAGQSSTLNVTYSPQSSGASSGSLTLISNAPSSPTTIGLSGSGSAATPQLTITPGVISFGNVVVGATNSQTVQISNTGSASLTISAASLTGTGFTTAGLSVPLSLAPQQTGTFNVQFAPQAATSAAGSLTLLSNAPGSPTPIALSGTGVKATSTLSANPSAVIFGSVNTGSSASQIVTLTNTGNSNVAISQVSVSGAAFGITGAGAPVTLSPTQSIAVTVLFNPTAAGAASGSLIIASDATGAPSSIPISGTGVIPAVKHSVTLSWTASMSAVSGYYVYRTAVSGGGYTKLNASPNSSVSYTDTSVQNSQTYYYVTTAVNAAGTESAYSNEVTAVVP